MFSMALKMIGVRPGTAPQHTGQHDFVRSHPDEDRRPAIPAQHEGFSDVLTDQRDIGAVDDGQVDAGARRPGLWSTPWFRPCCVDSSPRKGNAELAHERSTGDCSRSILSDPMRCRAKVVRAICAEVREGVTGVPGQKGVTEAGSGSPGRRCTGCLGLPNLRVLELHRDAVLGSCGRVLEVPRILVASLASSEQWEAVTKNSCRAGSASRALKPQGTDEEEARIRARGTRSGTPRHRTEPILQGT